MPDPATLIVLGSGLVAVATAMRQSMRSRVSAADGGRIASLESKACPSSTRFANWRHRSSARSCAGTATSLPPRMPCRRRSSPLRCNGRKDGVPDNPRGWLIQVASRRMTDYIRSESARRRRETAAAAEIEPTVDAPGAEGMPPDADDTLVLLFLCCHPALSTASAIALTLRAVGGLTTAEIARAFLVPEATMAQRISRAKQSIRTSGVRFVMPDAAERAARLEAVQHVLYLIFNEGYTSSSGPSVHRPDLANEAIRLTRALLALLPDVAETAGLLALMLLTDARRDTRTGPDGELIPLTEQDRIPLACGSDR